MKMKSHNLRALKTEANAPSGSTQAAPEAKAIQSRSGSRRTAERRQIVAGATAVLRSFGYDAARKDEIAKATGVSTNTLHAHFKSKDKLFQTVAEEESAFQGGGVSKLNVPSPDVAGELTRIGVAYVRRLYQPEQRSTLRAVTAVAGRKPNVGRTLYETGPAIGIAALAAYLEAEVAAGRLEIEDCEVAAAQFMESCQVAMREPMMLNFVPSPAPERIRHVVRIAVKVFMAAYGRSRGEITAAPASRPRR